MNRLVIIGNGFDLHHNLSTSYHDFRDYLANGDVLGEIKMPRNGDLLNILDSYFEFDCNWSDFEKKLSSLNLQDLIDEECVDIVLADDDEHPMRNQAIIEDACLIKLDCLRNDLPKEINNWILSQSYNVNKDLLVDFFDKQDTFISFNYSSTLEKLYGVNSSKIIYLHGKADKTLNGEQIVIGHGTKNIDIPDYIPHTKTLNDIFASDVYEDNKNIYEDLYKNPSKHISKLEPILKFIRNCSDVIILGHSLSNVDKEYFQFINNNLSAATEIKIFYYNEKELSSIKISAYDYFPRCNLSFSSW